MKGPAIFLAQFAGTAPPFIRAHMIRTTTKAFDDFAASSGIRKCMRAFSA